MFQIQELGDRIEITQSHKELAQTHLALGISLTLMAFLIPIMVHREPALSGSDMLPVFYAFAGLDLLGGLAFVANGIAGFTKPTITIADYSLETITQTRLWKNKSIPMTKVKALVIERKEKPTPKHAPKDYKPEEYWQVSVTSSGQGSGKNAMVLNHCESKEAAEKFAQTFNRNERWNITALD